MPSRAEAASCAAGAAAPTILVLLCRDLQGMVSGLDLAALQERLADPQSGVRVVVQDGLCRSPAAIRDGIRATGAQRLVLGLCSGDYPEIEVQAHVRKAGLDPLGIQALDLSRCRNDSPSATLRARMLLSAAVARAASFRGSRPENLKTVLLPPKQKVSRRALFTLPPVSYVPVPSIDRTLCAAEAGCRQCVDACPYTALTRDGSAIVVDRERCQTCGACVAACPQRAVELPGFSAEEVEGEAAAFLASGETGSGAICFVCKEAAAPASGWLPVKVPCLAMVPAGAILSALAQGASAVALVHCGGSCVAGRDERLRGRVDYCRQLLTLLGESPERVQLADGPDVHLEQPALLPIPPLGENKAGAESAGRIRLFGCVATAQAVRGIAARRASAPSVALEHPHSPLGVVRISQRACTACGACASGCPTGALACQRNASAIALVFDPGLCIGCGQCVSLCPERAAGAIGLSRMTDPQLLAAGSQVVLRDQEARCQRCGAPVASRRALERIAAMLGDNYNQRLGSLCSDCKGLPWA